NELESLPAGIERMTGLRNLFLQSNKLKTLPVGLRELNQLEILDISKNALNGELNFVGMNGLKTLRMGENNISSVIVFGLRNLEEVNLDNNELRAFPFSRTEHPKLMKVSVRWNRLTFEDLEEAVLENWTLGYVPQKRFSADEERRVVAGNPVEWLLSVGGTANEYSWYKNGVQVAGQTNNRLFLPTVNVNDAGVYELHVRSNKVAGLELVSGQMRLVVNCGAALVLEGVSSLQFCSNVPVEGRLRVRGGDAQWDYRWYRDGVEQLLMRGTEVVVTLAGTYEVRVKDNNGCERVSNSLKVTVLRAPEVRVKEVSEFVLEAEGEGEGEYQWYRDGVLIEGAKAKRYEVEKRGVYWVKFTSKATGCEAYSEAKKFSITGLSEEELLNAIEIYPNPVREETTISFGETVVGKVQLELINLNGMVLKEWQLDTLEGRSKQLHMSDLASGVYLLRIRHDDVLLIKRLTKQ
ncbi:MAG: T9SS type A sorting domain-containing protein, partial [Flammeovirgaceae bacterium]|nr:T9SS type A sorting domain-containing protein [Flammeovirgaceae bacterium]MDW8288017.1 T9SS type A sorting domain-containing protein [Flammeovirgaceae bacterium]